MLKLAKQFEGLELQARDGAVGNVSDLYFDDAEWRVRYLVVDTGSWLSGRSVLISTAALVTTATGELSVFLTKEQVRNSPGIDTDKPVSRQYEEQLHAYYAWPYYWGGPFVGGGLTSSAPAAAVPVAAATERRSQASQASGMASTERPAELPGDPHLRSADEVRGYHIQARDGAIGHIEDFVVDGQSWEVRHVIVDTRNWWPGRKVMLSRDRLVDIDWVESRASVDLTRDAIKGSPEFDPGKLSQDYTDRLEAHYRGYPARR